MNKQLSNRQFWADASIMIIDAAVILLLVIFGGGHPVLCTVVAFLVLLVSALLVMSTFSKTTSHAAKASFCVALIALITSLCFGFMSGKLNVPKEQPKVQIDTIRTIQTTEERLVFPDGTSYYKSVIETTEIQRGIQNAPNPIEIHYSAAFLSDGVEDLDKYNDIIARYEADNYSFEVNSSYVLYRLECLGYTEEQFSELTAHLQGENLRKIGYTDEQINNLWEEVLLNEWFKSGEQYELYQRLHSEYEFYIMGAYNHRGVIYDRMGEYEKALADQFRALKMCKMGYEPDILNCIGQVYYHMGQYDAALDYYTQGADDRRGKNSSYNRGVVYMAMGRYEDAVAEFQAVLNASYFKSANVYNNLALSLIALGRKDEAIKAFTDAIDVSQDSYYGPSLPPLKGGVYSGPRRFYRHSQYHGKPDYEYTDWCYYHQGRQYNKYNSSSKYYYNRAVLYSQLGMSALAERDFRVAVITQP